MFAADKYLTPFLTPLGLVLILGLLAFLLVLFGSKRSGLALLLAAPVCLYATSTPFLSASCL